MKKRHFTLCSMIMALSLLLAAGCGAGEEMPGETNAQTETAAQTETEAESPTASQTQETVGSKSGETDLDQPLQAMYLTSQNGDYLFVGTENGVLFTAPVPDELYDETGEKITADQLTVGSVLDIYGNNIMLESYPGQYPGVTKMTVVQKGTQEDIAPYQHLIDEIYTEPDPSQLPYMDVEYTTDQAIVTAALSQGNYTWSYTDENGQSQSSTGCGDHILAWDNLAEISLPKPTDLKIIADGLQSVTVTRWPVSMQGTEQYDTGETIETEERDGAFWIPQAESGYIYLIQGVWEQGEIEYGFCTK